MGPEFWVTLASAFVAGGAIGSSGVLLAQWILKKVDGHQTAPGSTEYKLLRMEVSQLGRQMRNVDARLDFAEQLLGGALPLSSAPSRLPDEFEADQEDEETEEAPEG